MNTYRILIVLLGATLFIPGLGDVHLFDWDEINFAESAREMIMSGDYLRVQINFEPFWEKPPLFIWFQVISMKIFGINEFAARFPNAMIGILTLIVLFEIGTKVINKNFGLLWVAGYVGTLLPHFYFKTGIIDPLFNLLIFCGIYQLYQLTDKAIVFSKGRIERKAIQHTLLGGFFIGLAILTKGPVALLIAGTTLLIVLIIYKRMNFALLGYFFLFGIAVFVTSAIWFGLETFYHGPWFIMEFIEYNARLLKTEDSGHGQPFYYHPVVLLIGCFPISLFFLGAIIKAKDTSPPTDYFIVWMKVLFWVVLIIFSIVKTKIVHYSSMCYFPITFLGSYYIYNSMSADSKASKWIISGILFIGFIISSALIVLPLIPQYKSMITPLIQDSFVNANINLPVYWSGYEQFIGVLFMTLIIISIFFSKKIFRMAMVLFFGSCITLQMLLYSIVPKLEKHIQGTMIDFYQKIKDEDCYVIAVGHKSYAPYFYTYRKPEYHKHPKSEDEDWLLHGDIDKHVYIMTKNGSDSYDQNPELKVVLKKGGYVVYKREKNKII